MSKTLTSDYNNSIRGDVMPKIFTVVIHLNEDTDGFWAECPFENGSAFTDGETIRATQINMFESVALFLQNDYPDINDFLLSFVLSDE